MRKSTIYDVPRMVHTRDGPPFPLLWIPKLVCLFDTNILMFNKTKVDILVS